MGKNYYSILGVHPTATAEEIKSAYRSRVKQYHPDRYGENSTPFLKIQEAYDVLSDPSLRRRYDRSLRESESDRVRVSLVNRDPIRRRRPTVEPLRSSARILDLGEAHIRSPFMSPLSIFEEAFEGYLSDLEWPEAIGFENPRIIPLTIRISRSEAMRGGVIRVRLPIDYPCRICWGSGWTGAFECSSCQGTGHHLRELSLSVEIPPGITDRYEVALPLGRHGLPATLLVCVISPDSAWDPE